ncbi:MAG: hypothetical protein GX087_11050 [Desulfobulbaceae bacterium]|nr:hypothetical protein [Desulfobulbaceae bacterium]
MYRFFDRVTYMFDPLHDLYERDKVHRKIALVTVLLFIVAIFCIELNRQDLLPPAWAAALPDNHFHAISMAFTIVLILEVISLIFALPCSFSRSLGKQFEILALIFMRNAFKELSLFPEPLAYSGNEEQVLHILASGFGALIIFILLGLYYRVQKKAERDGRQRDLYGFVASKKAISLFLLLTFASMGIWSVLQAWRGVEHADFFHEFYTILILTDILIVLVSQCFCPSSIMIFRNSGYAFSTLTIRIALVAPVYYNVLLGSAAVCFALLLSLASQRLFTERE